MAISRADATLESNVNFAFRLSLQFYRLFSSPVERGQTRTIRGWIEDRAIFAASPKSSDGTGHEPAIAVKAARRNARAAFALPAYPQHQKGN